MKKIMIGLLIVAVSGVGVTTMASTSEGILKPTVKVNPVDINETEKNNIKNEILNYIEANYGANWANDLYNKDGENWDDILEDQLENKFGRKYEELIEDIIEAKEHEAGLDDIDDNDDLDDKYDDIDDKYDDLNDRD